MAEGNVSAIRILDAAANRAAEGLRVVEDYLRFSLDDGHLTGICKQLRHDLTSELYRLPAAERFAARDTEADIGRTISTAAESDRCDLPAVVAANLNRVKQAVRSLEEYGKLIDPELGSAFERLRYRVYTLERAINLTRAGIDRLDGVRLCVLVDGRDSLAEFESLVDSFVRAEAGALQLRDKRLTDRELMERARRLREKTRDTKTLAIVNDRADIAQVVGADGVHVGQDDVAVKDARTVVGVHSLIGVSTHSIQQARAAVLSGANYIGVGPTYPSTTKTFDAFGGLDLLREVAGEIRLPAFAIGGIGLENLEVVLGTGITRVAVGAAIINARDPEGAVREFNQRLSAS